jgi:predicted anti-sigma-YlaC factor YlaD
MTTVILLSEAWKTTLAQGSIWFIFFPALVTALIGYAIVQARGEKAENDSNRRYRR